MNKKIMAAISAALIVLGLSGCGTSQSSNTTQNNTASQSKNDNSMQNMPMDMPMDNQSNSKSQPLAQAFQDELNGFSTIQKDIGANNWSDATRLADNLHNEFHDAILGPLKDKKGADYAENIHGKYDELQDAISSKDTQKINDLIKVNRDNLYAVANILGVNLQK